MEKVSATGLRAKLPEYIRRVEAGEKFAITRWGKVVAVLISPQEYNVLKAVQGTEGLDLP